MDYEELAGVLAAALEQGRYERDDLYLFDTQLAWEMTNQAHVRDPQRAMVSQALQAHPDIVPLLGKHLNRPGLNPPQLSAAALGDWLLTHAWRIGAQGATAELRDFVESPHCDVDECLAVSGLRVDGPITLSPGVDLLPMTSIPESRLSISLTDPGWLLFGRDEKGHVKPKTVEVLASFGVSTWHTNPHVASGVLRVRRSVSPKVVSVPAQETPSPEAMIDTLLVIAAATGTAIFPVAHWVAATPPTPLWDSFGWTYWSHVKAIRPFATAVGNEKTILAAVRAWEAFPARLKPKVKVSLERLNRGLAASLPVDRAIDLGISLEALLLTDLAPNDQISLAFRLRGAWLLGANTVERGNLARQFSAIYTCRSAAVHDGKLPKKSYLVGSKKVPADEFTMDHAPSLAARAVLRVIELGHIPDWNTLLLGAGPQMGGRD
jgi:hypothetical protein